MTAAAVILPEKLPRAISREIRDSKKMTHQQREDLFQPLTELCLYAVAEATVAEIAQYNILWASMLAMKRAVEGLQENLLKRGRCVPLPLAGGVRGGLKKLGSEPENDFMSSHLGPPPAPPASGRGVAPLLLQNDFPKIDIVDRRQPLSPQLGCKAVAIIEGDDKSLSIAAASIIAKVTRDRLMRKLAEEHPGYGWERNAGYGTRRTPRGVEDAWHHGLASHRVRSDHAAGAGRGIIQEVRIVTPFVHQCISLY